MTSEAAMYTKVPAAKALKITSTVTLVFYSMIPVKIPIGVAIAKIPRST